MQVMNRNIPYADTFFVSCQYCMTRVAHNKTRLRVTANINFRKSCWGVVKSQSVCVCVCVCVSLYVNVFLRGGGDMPLVGTRVYF